MTDDSRVEALLELLALYLQGRPERVTGMLLRMQPPEVKGAAAMVADAMATLAAALPPEPLPVDAAGGDPLRARILATLGGAPKPKRAVVVIDMQNDNLMPGSAVEVPRARAIVPALKKRLDEARAAGVPVVYIIDQHDLDDEDLDFWTTHNVRGSKGAEVWADLAPREGDIQVTKSTYSAFTGSRLDAVLDELKVDTLVLTGCVTEVGVMATALDALQRGFTVEVPPDAQAGSSELAEGAALATLALLPPFGPAHKARLERAHRA